MAKSKAERKKQKRKAKQKQVKTSRFQQTSRERGWSHYHDACYFFDSGNIDQAVKSIKRTVRDLPNEEDVLQLMGHIGSSTQNRAMELDALAGMERIGKITDEMKVSMVFMLVSLERYKECFQKTGDVLKIFTGLRIKDKRKIKKKLEDLKEYCRVMILSKEEDETPNAMFSRPDLPKENGDIQKKKSGASMNWSNSMVLVLLSRKFRNLCRV